MAMAGRKRRFDPATRKAVFTVTIDFVLLPYLLALAGLFGALGALAGINIDRAIQRRRLVREAQAIQRGKIPDGLERVFTQIDAGDLADMEPKKETEEESETD